MTLLRVGTRGSELARRQTRGVCDELRRTDPSLRIEEVIVRTYGDKAPDRPFGADWPVGAFVHALEQALLDRRIDVAVHSYKDLQTAPTPGLAIAAVPRRGLVHDVLLTLEAVHLEALPRGFRVGTGSPRRAAQLRRLGELEIVPIRGNVPTRVERLRRGEIDGIVSFLHRRRVRLPCRRVKAIQRRRSFRPLTTPPAARRSRPNGAS
jgi:hydroxymethylbilane synthase